MNKFELLDTHSKISLLLFLTDLILPEIKDSDGFEIAVESMQKCWEWLENKDLEAFDLYLYLENENEEGVMDYLMLEDNPYKEKIWICIANSLAYTISKAYEFEKSDFLPQTIECVDFDTIQQFIDNFGVAYKIKNDLWNKLLDFFLNELAKNPKKEISRNTISQFIESTL